jgi:hypothetical protein
MTNGIEYKVAECSSSLQPIIPEERCRGYVT